MNYYIEKHDMEIILDALECLHNHITNRGKYSNYPWTLEQVDGLLQSFDNSGADDAIKKLKPMEDGKFGFYTGK